MANGALTGLHHIALSVRDLDVSAAWYESVFELDTLQDERGDTRRARVYRLRGTNAMLGLTEHASNANDSFAPQRTGLDHAAFAVATRADIEAWTARLDAVGVAHSGVIDIPLGAILNFADPDGIQLALFYASAASG